MKSHIAHPNIQPTGQVPAPVLVHRAGPQQHGPGAAGSRTCPQASGPVWTLRQGDTPSGLLAGGCRSEFRE